ncbi:MAG: MFS transporter [Candidatus Thorarchaeota archaeon]|nr:MFS transporter [Candidatus Thorarchaeota archaeon]
MSVSQSITSDWRALRSVYNSAFACSLGFFVVRFLLPIIAYASMGASAIQVALIFSLLTLGAALFSPVAGRAAKRGRRRESIFFGATVRALAYTGMAISIIFLDVNMLIINSLIWGLGAAFYQVGSDAEISERVLRENRAEAFGRRAAANGRGQVIGAFIGFTLLFTLENIMVIFLFYAASNLIGGLIVVRHRPPLEKQREIPNGLGGVSVVGLGIAALVIAAALDTFISALLSPFVELYILEVFTTDILLVALVYLPGGIISGMFGGYMGRFADHKSKIGIVSAAVIVGALSTLGLVFVPAVFAFPVDLLMVALLFSIGTVTGTMAYTVMSSIFGTAYEGRASEGFGMFESAMGFSRFSAPLVGGILWDFLDPTAPFILVGLSGFVLVPIYAYGMKKYEQAVQQQKEP